MNVDNNAGIDVSVIIPTYNRKQKLIDTLRRIDNSQYGARCIELIVVDDGSTDGTGKSITSAEIDNIELRYMRTPSNLGPAAARNMGIKHSRGEYLYFTDDDCLPPKHLINEFADFLDRNPGVAGVGGGLTGITDNWISRFERFKDKLLGIAGKGTRIGRDFPSGFTSNMMYRKRVLRETGYFDENFKVPAGEDLELKNRIAVKYDLAFMPINVVHNHEYDLNYLLGAAIKQGLNKNPPIGVLRRAILLLAYAPLLACTVIRKIIQYRIFRHRNSPPG